MESTKEQLEHTLALLKKMKPDDEGAEFKPFDESKKDDYIYCIEWGMNKQEWIEHGIYQAQIDRIEEELKQFEDESINT